MNKILTAAVLLCISMLAFAEEPSIEKPKTLWVYSMITWYDELPLYTNEFPYRSEGVCLKMRAKLNSILKQFEDDDPLFGYIGECTKRTI